MEMANHRLSASVMRIVAPHQPDWSMLHVELNQGKWQATLDLRQDEDKEKLRTLVRDADVFLEGYRPFALDKYGFGLEEVLKLCENRSHGIIYVRENCYGWQGPLHKYTGWQQISDANCGISYGYGKAMGLDEPVTPIFPNSDFCTGLAGSIAVITALLQRADKGGSYVVDLALNYYSQWLANTVGTYPSDIWELLWTRYDKHTVRHDQNMQESVGPVLALLKQKAGSTLFQPQFFCEWPAIARSGNEMIRTKVRTVAPVLKFEGNTNGKEVTQPGFDISVRGNGIDQARWPENLAVDVVA